jgi:hypothetical protein
MMTTTCTHEGWQRYARLDGTVACAGCETDALRPSRHPVTDSRVYRAECPVCGGRYLTVYGTLVHHGADGVACAGSGGPDRMTVEIHAYYDRCAAEGIDSGD